MIGCCISLLLWKMFFWLFIASKPCLLYYSRISHCVLEQHIALAHPCMNMKIAPSGDHTMCIQSAVLEKSKTDGSYHCIFGGHAYHYHQVPLGKSQFQIDFSANRCCDWYLHMWNSLLWVPAFIHLPVWVEEEVGYSFKFCVECPLPLIN